jgi:long-chain acyl-CoA synthetase
MVRQRGYRREAWTYEKLVTSAVSRALQLKRAGVRTNDRVLLWGLNSGQWVAAFWGCLIRGAVVVPLDDSSTPGFANRVVADAGIKFAIAVFFGLPSFFESAPSDSLARLWQNSRSVDSAYG